MTSKSSAMVRAVLSALFMGASAQATILNEYTDLATWTAATTSQVNQNFNGLGTLSNGTSAGITLNSINYRGFYNESSSVGYDTYSYTPPVGSGDNTGSLGIMMGGSNTINGTGSAVYDTGLRVDLGGASSIRGMAFDYSAWRGNRFSPFNQIYSTAGTPIVLTLQVYESNVLTSTKNLTVGAGSPALSFFAFTTTGNISGIRLLINTPTNTDMNRVVLDNFAYAQIAAGGGGGGGGGGGEIPEPQTYLLCAAGLLGAALIRRKTR